LRLAAMDAFAKRKRPYCTSEYLRTVGFSAPPRIVEQIDAGFKDLKDILHHARPSQGDDLQPLFRGVRDMQAVIEGWNEYFDDERITEPFRLAAIDAYAERKRRSRPSAAIPDSDFSSLFQSIKRSEDNLSAFKNMLDHFRRLIEEFDGLDRHSLEAQEEADWIKRGSGSLGQSVRLYLAPYLRNRKDGGLGPDTKLVRLIAELYEYVYGKPFRINGSESKPSYHRAAKKLEWQGANTPAGSLRSGGLVQYKYGDAMKFACSVITHLHLHSIIAPFKTDELGFDPSIHGEHERPTEHDARKHNRSLGPQYRSVPRAVLIHRIGDIWKRDRRRPK
jgi:hypothetical protein